MQYDERKARPESTRKILAQQVQEQSDLCDVILKMGHWEKKFHRCVLVTSPFFDHVLKDNFLEKQTGKIEMKLGTPSTIEMAVMFLYGKRPKLTEGNIDHMLHLAEFLLIPNLKSTCISWLKSVNITEENCMNLLQLSSIFDFDYPKCTEYIEEHMSEMLRQSQMLNLTNDSIDLLFTDKKLSYLSMDEKLTFLLRWRDSRPDQRSNYFKELLATIDFHEVSKTLLQELCENRILREIIDLEQFLDGIDDELTTQRVLIMKGIEKASFWCLDLERNRWFRIDSRALKEENSYHYNDISGKGTGDSDIYFTARHYRHSEILTLNLQSDTYKKFKLVDKESGEDFKQFDDLDIVGDTCIVNINERVKTRKQRSQTAQSIEMRKRLAIMSLMGCNTFDQLLAVQLMENDGSISTVHIDTSTLYIGHMDDENVQMAPLLTFKDDEISKLCIGNSLTVAVLFKSHKFVSIYDLVDHSLERIELSTDYNDKLAQSEGGFIIYNNKRCICLTRLIGPSLSEKYRVKEVSFGGDRFLDNRLLFCGETWYHFYRKSYNDSATFESRPRKSYNDSATFESLPHDFLASVNSTENLTWNPLPLPKEDSRCYGETIKERCFEIYLPKSKLRCDIECPHCKVTARTTTRTTARTVICRNVTGDDSSYEDSSDDDYYRPAYYHDYGVYYDDSD